MTSHILPSKPPLTVDKTTQPLSPSQNPLLLVFKLTRLRIFYLLYVKWHRARLCVFNLKYVQLVKSIYLKIKSRTQVQSHERTES